MQIEYTNECLKKLNLDKSELLDMVQKERANTDPNHNGKCFAACYVQKVGYIVDGVIVEDVLQGLLPDDVTVHIDECQTVSDIDNCEKTYKMIKCIANQLSDINNLWA